MRRARIGAHKDSGAFQAAKNGTNFRWPGNKSPRHPWLLFQIPSESCLYLPPKNMRAEMNTSLLGPGWYEFPSGSGSVKAI
jgi:hypothetical protein